MSELIDFICPRCSMSASARFYGPCGSCSQQLRDSLGSVGHDIEVAAYEPKMNVTPNAVATKD